MDVLASAGFDPNGMSSFFEKLQQRYGSGSQYVPEILQTHPLTAERIADTRGRARQMPQTKHADSVAYNLTKARLLALNAPTPEAAMALFQSKANSPDPADRYGLALASMRMSLSDNAERLFHDLMSENPTVIAYRIGEAEALAAGGATDKAMAVYREAQRLFPRNIPLTISHAEALIAAGKPAEAHALLLDLLNNVEPTPEQLRLIARAANAEGDVGNAYFYMSYYYASIGNLRLSINQVRMALETPGVHTVDRARFEARLKQLIDYLPEDQRDRAAVLNGP
jgi:predicted Zn-dependent protease